ncbi:Avr9/Cf-9 rapidly elicited protein 146 [Striga asiatica]|uniref:Avr9/Cf-9 rapidly elicited protein 146 n=1 Tax=Striga asiatica TaxID=4170 RepID=A0A5A7QJA2_STRAF|nr:Avr9/Cf-9 rapidly elicited protein 146 [Striga asiatica]
MEQNLAMVAKKIWKLAQAIYFMLRKGFSKGKLLSAVNTMMRRGKVAGKEAIQNLIFHHHHHHAAAAGRRDYEFTCGGRNSGGRPLSEADLMEAAVVMAASAAASPALPGFGRSPLVRRLRVTDSPFPLRDVEESCHVDEAAEEFIMKFYRDLRHQNSQSQTRSIAAVAASPRIKQILAVFPEAFNQNLSSALSRIESPIRTAAPRRDTPLPAPFDPWRLNRLTFDLLCLQRSENKGARPSGSASTSQLQLVVSDLARSNFRVDF